VLFSTTNCWFFLHFILSSHNTFVTAETDASEVEGARPPNMDAMRENALACKTMVKRVAVQDTEWSLYRSKISAP